MPEQSHPPYVPGAKTIPRQLNRWLDVNAQNGPLERAKKFLSIPAFTFSNDNWKGYSQVIGQFNYQAPNSLSLRFSDVANLCRRIPTIHSVYRMLMRIIR